MKQTLSLLSQVRDHYLAKYRDALTEYLHKYQPSSPEVLFELPHPERPYAFRLYRADMASNVNGQPCMSDVNPSTHLHFPPFLDRSEGRLGATVHPIAWNGVEFRCTGEFRVDQLETWCLKWLDIDDVGPKDETGLLGAIHSVTEPEAKADGIMFSVDFGSAPTTAVAELFRALEEIGVSHVKLSSSCLGET